MCTMLQSVVLLVAAFFVQAVFFKQKAELDGLKWLDFRLSLFRSRAGRRTRRRARSSRGRAARSTRATPRRGARTGSRGPRTAAPAVGTNAAPPRCARLPPSPHPARRPPPPESDLIDLGDTPCHRARSERG